MRRVQVNRNAHRQPRFGMMSNAHIGEDAIPRPKNAMTTPFNLHHLRWRARTAVILQLTPFGEASLSRWILAGDTEVNRIYRVLALAATGLLALAPVFAAAATSANDSTLHDLV